MYVQIELRGTSPLICHNIALSDPENEFAQEIAKISSKRKKTKEDYQAIGKNEWYGGLYLSPVIDGPVMPTTCIKRMLVEAAKVNKLGKHISRAISFTDVQVPISYEGPRNIDELYKDKKYHYRTAVGINRAKVMRVRPQFPEWAIVAHAYLLQDILDVQDLIRVVELAGKIEGLCDNRINGYGRFVGKVNILETV